MTYNANERDSQKWFSLAIQAGHLSTDATAKNYVGNYMFMGTRHGVVYFKHCVTREYHNISADRLIGKKQNQI